MLMIGWYGIVLYGMVWYCMVWHGIVEVGKDEGVLQAINFQFGRLYGLGAAELITKSYPRMLKCVYGRPTSFSSVQ